MSTHNPFSLIKESFEAWYNTTYKQTASIVINYNDLQKYKIKAIHTCTLELAAVWIHEGKAYIRPLINLQENYNRGQLSEEEAKENILKRLLIELYSFQKAVA